MSDEALLSIRVPGEPCPKGRPRFGQGRTYTPAATRYAEAYLAHQARRVLRRSLDDREARFWLDLQFGCGRAWGPDIDNLLKLVMDALSPHDVRHHGVVVPGFLWHNDRQIVDVRMRRNDGEREPFTLIRAGRVG